MTRTTAKNRINKILRVVTAGIHSDDCWNPVHNAWNALREAGFEPEIQNTRYGQREDGTPTEKVWFFDIYMAPNAKPIHGVLTCHGAGTVADPLSRYDISAYVS